MSKPFNELTKHFSDERKARIEKEQQLLFLEYDLISQLRKDRELTQQELAEILDIRQAAISKIEGQDDILVGTLEKYVRALGGELEIIARFPNKLVKLNQFVCGNLAQEGNTQ
ncbi:MAG: helix-turn-helix transcriptional regulator [Trueperaceae bacterium]|nr:MAG: helix-turn-helix transcriptional regulator [Trueperaceae bacterium]